MMEVRDLVVRAGDFRLGEISLRVEKGRTHVLLGPTGSGKSTLLETIVGLRSPESGRILVEGKEITQLPVERRELGYLPQDLALFPHLTVEGNILYGLRMRGLSPGIFLEELVEVLGIRRLLNRRTDTLSGGERQRVALARALAPGYRYLLLDEPFSALHEGLRRELWFLLRDLQRRYGLTVLLVTHDLEEAFFLGDTVSVIMEGRIQQTGSRETVYRFPKTLRVARFFGLKNLFEGRVESVGEGALRVRVPVLGEILVVEGSEGLSEGYRITLGIRPEDVMFPRPEYLRPDQENLLLGRITALYPKKSSWWVLCRVEGSGFLLEVELPDYAREKLGLREGALVKIILPRERIFILLEEK